MLAAGAASALVGIVQYSILHYDNLDLRPRSTLGISLTFSGLMMLVLNLALARVLFMTRSRIWPALVMPAPGGRARAHAREERLGRLVRARWLLCCLMMRDFRMTALLPIIAALFFATAAPQRRPRPLLFHLRSPRPQQPRPHLDDACRREDYPRSSDHGRRASNMIERVYPWSIATPDAVLQTPPHLHNVPLQIAAERGLPALGLWIWFRRVRRHRRHSVRCIRSAPREGPLRFLSAAAAVATVVAMLGAGMFEHNFGDSEFLMMFLVLITPLAVRGRTGRFVHAP